MRSVFSNLAAPAIAAGTYYAVSFIQVIFHRWFGHSPRIPQVYKQHVHGHHADYRGHRLTSGSYIQAERHVMWWYALPLVPLGLLAAWLLPLSLFLVHVAAVVFAITWHLYLHEQYHLEYSRWARFGWFRTKRALHLQHHLHHHGNYAIVEFWWDRLLGTYDARPPKRGDGFLPTSL